jgi:hypothetical protein
LQVAVSVAGTAVYSLHKSSTREYIERKVRSWGAEPAVLAEMRFAIPNMYAFHQNSNVDVAVDLWRIDTSLRPRGLPFECDPVELCAVETSMPVRHGGREGTAKGQRSGRKRGGRG